MGECTTDCRLSPCGNYYICDVCGLEGDAIASCDGQKDTDMTDMKDTNPKDAIGTAKWRQFFVIPLQVLCEVGAGMLEGALKYGRHNYRGAGVRASVYVDAAMGHLIQFVEGEDIDEDSELSHITKAICSLFVLRDAMMNDFWVDDRPPKIKDLDGLRERLAELGMRNRERYADEDPYHYTEQNDGSSYGVERPQDPPATFWDPEWDDGRLLESARSTPIGGQDSKTLEDCKDRFESNGGFMGITKPIEWDGEVETTERVGEVSHTEIVRFRTSSIRSDSGPQVGPCKWIASLLDDFRYLPMDKIDSLGDDDPNEILWMQPGSAEYHTAQIIEGLTNAQFHRLIVKEAEDIHGAYYEGDMLMHDALARRVLLRLKSRGKLWHTVTKGLGEEPTRMFSRLRGDEWNTIRLFAVADDMPRVFA